VKVELSRVSSLTQLSLLVLRLENRHGEKS
jgi:hypothetical protein